MQTKRRVDVPQTNSSCRRMNMKMGFNFSFEPAQTLFYTGETAKLCKNKQTSFMSAGVLRDIRSNKLILFDTFFGVYFWCKKYVYLTCLVIILI